MPNAIIVIDIKRSSGCSIVSNIYSFAKHYIELSVAAGSHFLVANAYGNNWVIEAQAAAGVVAARIAAGKLHIVEYPPATVYTLVVNRFYFCQPTQPVIV